MDFTIRLAQLRDAPALTQLIREIGLFARINNEPPEVTAGYVEQMLTCCLADDSHRVLVAQAADGAIQGYLSLHWMPYLIHSGLEGYISELFIHNTARGQGIGSALLDAAIAAARERGCDRLMLVNIRQRESYQREFYKKHGWEERPDAANFIYTL